MVIKSSKFYGPGKFSYTIVNNEIMLFPIDRMSHIEELSYFILDSGEYLLEFDTETLAAKIVILTEREKSR